MKLIMRRKLRRSQDLDTASTCIQDLGYSDTTSTCLQAFFTLQLRIFGVHHEKSVFVVGKYADMFICYHYQECQIYMSRDGLAKLPIAFSS